VHHFNPFDPFGFLAAVVAAKALYDAQRVAYYYARIDATTFMQWREQGIAGVANIPGC
jgi:hypothetical protein